MHLFIVYTGYVILFFNFILYSLGFLKNKKAYKIFTGYLFMTICVQLAAYLCLHNFYIKNLFLSHFYFIGQFILLSLFYLQLVGDRFQKKMIKIGFILVLLTLAVQYGLKPELFLKFNLYEIFITSFLLIIYAAFHFYNMLDEKKEFYYINTGILLYLFGSTILFLVGNLTAKLSLSFGMITWTLNAILVLVYQLFIMYEWKVSYYKTEKNTVIN